MFGLQVSKEKSKKKEFKILFYFGNLSNLLSIYMAISEFKKKILKIWWLWKKKLIIFSQKSFAWIL